MHQERLERKRNRNKIATRKAIAKMDNLISFLNKENTKFKNELKIFKEKHENLL